MLGPKYPLQFKTKNSLMLRAKAIKATYQELNHGAINYIQMKKLISVK
jgi:hypothetical protein